MDQKSSARHGEERVQVNDSSISRQDRLAALETLVVSGSLVRGPGKGEVNNHVHTVYSFSPYTPAAAALCAFESGLDAVGSVDHDSVGAAEETLAAGKILGFATTVGFEVRVSFAGTAFAEKRINYPDSIGNAYMVVHGVPRNRLTDADVFLSPYRTARVARTRRMTKALDVRLKHWGCGGLDFDLDVAPLTKLAEGGGVTERHLLAAASRKILTRVPPGPDLAAFLKERLEVEVSGKVFDYLVDPQNPHLLYDLLGVLKTTLLEEIFEQPGVDECPPVAEVTAFARSIDGIPSYAYLGDVGESPTGDKKAERFEDAYLDELAPALKDLGFEALTYMPPRNTLEQLLRVRLLCERFGLMEISGVDINSSRQSFLCPEILRPEFLHLNESTWALIAHEKLSARRPKLGLFHPGNPLISLPLAERIRRWAVSGRAMDPRYPDEIPLPEGVVP